MGLISEHSSPVIQEPFIMIPSLQRDSHFKLKIFLTADYSEFGSTSPMIMLGNVMMYLYYGNKIAEARGFPIDALLLYESLSVYLRCLTRQGH